MSSRFPPVRSSAFSPTPRRNGLWLLLIGGMIFSPHPASPTPAEAQEAPAAGNGEGADEAPEAGVPWRRRRRRGVRPSRRAMQLVSIADWPSEPASPPRDRIDPERFARALRTLCGWMPPQRPARWTGYILEHAAAFDVDPFLLAALAHRMGRCNADSEHVEGLGLTAIPRTMYGDYIRRGTYEYQVQVDGAWQPRTLTIDRFPFSEHQLRRAEPNFYFAAAIMQVWRTQADSLAAALHHAPHRHWISHFVWGDRIRNNRAEDRILTDRRRMLEYYGAVESPAPIHRDGIAWGPPLDGTPRVLSSWIGAERDEGARRHRGVDVESVLGEPVRAVADGRVNFAGVDFPGHRNSVSMSPQEIEAVPRDELGAGGRYVCVLHHTDEGAWRRSCYMHLEDVSVRHGQEVRRGDLLGTVGRTGMRRSAPHLHLELHGPDGLGDASVTLAGFLIGHRPED